MHERVQLILDSGGSHYCATALLIGKPPSNLRLLAPIFAHSLQRLLVSVAEPFDFGGSVELSLKIVAPAPT